MALGLGFFKHLAVPNSFSGKSSGAYRPANLPKMVKAASKATTITNFQQHLYITMILISTRTSRHQYKNIIPLPTLFSLPDLTTNDIKLSHYAATVLKQVLRKSLLVSSKPPADSGLWGRCANC
jgi:hypothetical protein